MKKNILVEELFFFIGSIIIFSQLSYSWWVFIVLFLAPDLSMFGYAHSMKMGAAMYNLVHHRALALSLYVYGYSQSIEWVMLTGVILFAHASLDRVFGYGFKYSDDFKHTHIQDHD